MAGWTNLTPSGAALASGNAYLFEDAGALKYQGTSGSAITMVNADGTSSFNQSFGSWAFRTVNGTAGTVAVSLLESDSDAFTVATTREYYFQGYIVATSVINSSVSTAVNLQFGGTATISSIDYTFIGYPAAAGIAARFGRSTSTGSTQLATTNSSATTFLARVEGTLITGSSGTIIPQIITTSSPSTIRPDAGSWFRFVELGASTNKTFGLGGWS